MDLRLEYSWSAGSIPAPDYYEYVIAIGPGPQGEICLRPDYPEANPPNWKESLTVSDKEYAVLINQAQNLLAVKDSKEPNIGRSQETLRLSHPDQQPEPISVSAVEARNLADAIKGLIPENTWRRLFDKFETYRNARR